VLNILFETNRSICHLSCKAVYSEQLRELSSNFTCDS